MANGKLLIFSAPSGSGKTTLVRHLLQAIPNLAFSISATTRAPRGSEQHGKEYYFLSPEEFRAKIAAGDFLEYEEVYPGLFYGSLRSEVERLWKEGKHVLFDIDVEGGMHLKELYGPNALALFVKVPSLEVLEQRLRNRGTDSEEKIKERLDKAAHEITREPFFDAVIINDDLQRAVAETEARVRQYLNT